MRKFQKEQAQNFIQLLAEAHEEIRANIEKKNYEPVLVTLADCQDGAIALGNLIENAEGDNCTTIPLLEKYCELVFRIHTDISDGGYVDALKTDKSLRKALTQIENSVRNDIKVRKEIAFFPYNASMWDSLESVYLAAKEDPDCDAYCVPIPYFEKKADGKLGQAHYEGAEYPKNIEITDWQTYNFEERRPDVMYIHNPYDASNRVTCVHPRFFSSNLKKYTDELVYIPYFVGPEIDPKDQAAIERMKHFCFLPGVIHADKVILQSENHRQVYIAEYSKAAKQFGLEAKHSDRNYLEEKFLALGSPKFDKVLRTKKEDIDIPDEWLNVIKKPDGNFKKIIFYNTSIQALLIHKEQMLKKMKHVLETFKENRDEVALLWRPHPLLESTIKSMLPQLWEEYDALIRQYREEGWGIWDDTKDMNRAVALSDAYYGDSSSVLQVYQKTGKPVMVQNAKTFLKREKMMFADNRIRIVIEDAVRLDRKIWFCAYNFNSLFALDIESKELRFCGEFPNELYGKCRLFASMKLIGRKIYFIPMYAKSIIIYDVDTNEFKSVELEKEYINGTSKKMLFMGVQQYNNFLYILPVYAPVIIRLNLDNNELDYIVEWNRKIRHLVPSYTGIYFRKQSVVIGTKLYVPFCNTNAVLELDCETLGTRIYQTEIETGGYTAICFAGKKVLLSPTTSKNLIVWDVETNRQNEVKLYDNAEKTSQCHYSGVVEYHSKIYAFPTIQKAEDLANENVIIMDGEYSFAKNEDNKIMFYEVNSGLLTIIGQNDEKISTEIAIENSMFDIKRFMKEREDLIIESIDFGVQQLIDAVQ